MVGLVRMQKCVAKSERCGRYYNSPFDKECAQLHNAMTILLSRWGGGGGEEGTLKEMVMGRGAGEGDVVGRV